jgi:hypothetical protein
LSQDPAERNHAATEMKLRPTDMTSIFKTNQVTDDIKKSNKYAALGVKSIFKQNGSAQVGIAVKI